MIESRKPLENDKNPLESYQKLLDNKIHRQKPLEN